MWMEGSGMLGERLGMVWDPDLGRMMCGKGVGLKVVGVHGWFGGREGGRAGLEVVGLTRMVRWEGRRMGMGGSLGGEEGVEVVVPLKTVFGGDVR